MALEFESLPLKDFLNAFYKEYADFQAENKQELKDKLESYKQNYEQNKNQNEPAIVANALAPLFESLGFQVKFAHKHKGNSEIDLALLKDSNVEILIEAKKPDNVAEMFKADKPNCKALHECILYYLREKEQLNFSIKYIIITNFLQFYILNAREFERHFCDHSKIKQAYQSFKNKILNQDGFYAAISKILNNDFAGNREGDLFNIALKGLYFDLRNDKHLSIAHKVLNRDFLHREYKRDPNALNPRFYKELLHILGLKEFDKGGKITIEFDDTQNISFAKHIASKLESHNKPSDFEAVMSHILIWLNRVLFLKLIEANLLHFNDFNKDLRFLSGTKITSFKHLSHLFFEVLARDYEARKQGGGGDKGFSFLPYLNSSLFIRDNALEILDIGALDDDLTIQIFESTQTTHKAGEKQRFLSYLFDFLNAFDFGKESNEDSAHKDLIRSSVLGAVFEKLNGYKEGSFYTPNFITSYMCKESLQKIVLDRFNTAFGWSAKDLESLRKQIDRDFGRVESQAKQLLESIRICDPSVGSGHFLVSVLNEMIAIYHKLGLLGFGYKDLQIKDDEIYLVTKEGEKFAYKRLQDSNHAIQIALFELKKSIIENNLFGVDINPNSCNIARLRLWIELLKNAYYLNFSKDKDSKIHKLQTLPNIDINIKCGNSLISHIDTNTTLENFTANLQNRLIAANKKQDLFLNQSLNSEIKDIEKKAQSKFQEMRENAESYKNEGNKQAAKAYKDTYENAYQYLCELFKRNCNEYINFHQVLKDFFHKYGYINLAQLELETKLQIESYVEFFDFHKSVDFERKTSREIPQKELENLLKLMQIYEEFNKQEAFEWRFAFPEVLDSNGDFLGFDLVIGNPPYIRTQGLNKQISEKYKQSYQTATKNYDIYVLFVEMGLKIIKSNASINFIMPHKWLNADFGEGLRNLVQNKAAKIIHFGDFQVFKASTYTALHWFNHQAKDLQFIKSPDSIQTEQEMTDFLNSITQEDLRIFAHKDLDSKVWNLSSDKTQNILMKIAQFTPTKDIFHKMFQGIATSKDSVYFLEQCKETSKGLIKGYSKELDLIVEIESDFAKPLLMGSSFHCYEKLESDLRVIFPYFKEVDSKGKEKMSLYSELDLQTHFPKGYAYLKQCEQVLRARENRRFDIDKWYQFGRAQGISEGGVTKLLMPYLSIKSQFAYDEKGEFYHNTKVFGLIKSVNYSSLDYKYLLAILNSNLMWWYITKTASVMRGGYYTYTPTYIENFYIPNLTPKEQKPFITLADKILKLKAKDSTTDTSTLESEIDSLVYKLYNLTENEIKIVENKEK